MSEPFLEERLAIGIQMGATYGDDYNVEITKTKSGREYRRLLHPYPERHYTISTIGKSDDLWSQLLGLYHRCYGRYAGFRVRAIDDYSTNANTGAPTAFDHPMALVSAGVYQLQKQYGTGGTPLAIGLPVRTLFKPVAGTVKIGVSGVEVAAPGWLVDTTTGRVTFSANKTATITAITKAAQAVVSCAGHTFSPGESVHISGVVGMTQINGKRALITAVSASVSITVALNTTAYSTYTGGGTLATRPQTGEAVTAGCEFDIPFRFDSTIDLSHISPDFRETPDIEIVELIAL